MCGIAGWMGPDVGWRPGELLAGLRRRGPDGEGVWSDAGATLVHTRLAILDLGAGGAQPMVWEGPDGAGATALVFNGEIYNFRELRSGLEACGEVFRSASDSEVLLRLLVRRGAACLPDLAGMFALGYWDAARGEGLLARDALGIKPLYYRVDGQVLAFASEARLLRRPGDAVDAAALRDFFIWGSVPEPVTCLAPVRQVPAGHCLRWSGGEATLVRWHVPREGGSAMGETGDGTVGRTRGALLESVRRHLVSDVPVGIFLSGGVDSTVVLALAREVLGPRADIRTFSIGFDDPAYDESGLARRTAGHFGARHVEWRMTAEEGSAEIPAFLEAADQPGIDGFNTWCVARLARREGMKVVLSGVGGDEWFAGYGSFTRLGWFRRLHRGLGPLRGRAAGLLGKTAPGTPWRRLAAYLGGAGGWVAAYHAQRGFFTETEASLLVRELTGETAPPVYWAAGDLPWDLPGGGAAAAGALEVTRYLRNQLLRDSDVYSMAQGLELRVPLVDARLAATLEALPQDVRLRPGKRLLLEAVPEVPKWVREQPKRGFRFPFQEWMEGRFGDLMTSAREVSPVPLRTWYRTWAVAAALRWLRAGG